MADQPKIDVRPEIDDELAELADKVMQRALKNGADQVAVRAGQGHFIELKQRDGKIESSRASRSRGISLTLYCDQRFSSNATSNLQPDALEAFVDRALTLTRVLEPDPHRGLAEPELYGATPDVELDSWDAAYPAGSEDEHLSTLAEIEAGAGQAEDPGSARGTILSVRSSYTLQASSSLQLHSNGFSGARAGTHFYGGATVTADEPGTDRRPEAHAFAGARHREDLPPVSTIWQRGPTSAPWRV
jgi:PmbA protein